MSSYEISRTALRPRSDPRTGITTTGHPVLAAAAIPAAGSGIRSTPIVTLYPFQQNAVAAALVELRSHRSTLIVMPTGTGKTQVFVALAALAQRGRVLMLAHRDELVQQAAARVYDQLGVVAGIEKAEQRAVHGPTGEQIVVGSVSTLRGKRLRAWPSEAFTLIVIDEAHHAAARSYQAITAHFSSAKVIGVTATPDRGDGRGLGRYFGSVAYQYDLDEAIRDGYLVEPIVWRIHIDEVNLGAVPRRAGDLVTAILEEQVAKGIHAAAAVLLERAGPRPTLVFTPGVATAHDLVEVLCAARPGCAAAIDGTTPTDDRRAILLGHATGAFQYLINCQVLTEGYDSPTIECLGLLRPTLSRGLYTQMLGRGLRLSPSTGKSDCLVLDFTDSSGRLDLVGPEDVLGGDDDAVVQEAKKELSESTEEPIRITEALARAAATVKHHREKIEAMRAKKKARRAMEPSSVRGFLGLPWKPEEDVGRGCTEKQAAALERFGVQCDEVTFKVASRLLGVLIDRSKKGLATLGQIKLLSRRRGRVSLDLSRTEASAMIDDIARRGWRR